MRSLGVSKPSQVDRTRGKMLKCFDVFIQKFEGRFSD